MKQKTIQEQTAERLLQLDHEEAACFVQAFTMYKAGKTKQEVYAFIDSFTASRTGAGK